MLAQSVQCSTSLSDFFNLPGVCVDTKCRYYHHRSNVSKSSFQETLNLPGYSQRWASNPHLDLRPTHGPLHSLRLSHSTVSLSPASAAATRVFMGPLSVQSAHCGLRSSGCFTDNMVLLWREKFGYPLPPDTGSR